MDNVVKLPDGSQLVESMKGAERSGNAVVIEGRLIPKLTMRETDTEVVFVLDGRLAYGFPKALAHHAAHFAATAMAIGGGYACITADEKLKAFAPTVIGLDALPS